MAEMLMNKIGGALHPATQADWDEFDKLAFGKPVVVKVRKSRNPDHLRKYWAVATAVANAADGFDTKEDADWLARMRCPFMRKEITYGSDGHGGVNHAVRPLSIALDKMEQGQFNLFYESAIRTWSEIIGRNPEEIGEFERTLRRLGDNAT